MHFQGSQIQSEYYHYYCQLKGLQYQAPLSHERILPNCGDYGLQYDILNFLNFILFRLFFRLMSFYQASTRSEAPNQRLDPADHLVLARPWDSHRPFLSRSIIPHPIKKILNASICKRFLPRTVWMFWFARKTVESEHQRVGDHLLQRRRSTKV